MKNATILFFILMAFGMFYISITTIMETHFFEGFCYFIVSLALLMLSLAESETED